MKMTIDKGAKIRFIKGEGCLNERRYSLSSGIVQGVHVFDGTTYIDVVDKSLDRWTIELCDVVESDEAGEESAKSKNIKLISKYIVRFSLELRGLVDYHHIFGGAYGDGTSPYQEEIRTKLNRLIDELHSIDPCL